MIQDFSCPACGNKEWAEIEKYLYLSEDTDRTRFRTLFILWRYLRIVSKLLILSSPSKTTLRCTGLTNYQKKRRTILFDIWILGRKQLTLTSIYCEQCGFATYTPRPTSTDIANKYDFLKRTEADIGGQSGHSKLTKDLDLARANRIYRVTSKYLETPQARILDYGGGNGKLLAPFLDDGYSCFIVDYNETPLKEITRLGDDIHCLSQDDRFDLAICSHVLEHVSNVNELVTKLLEHLSPEGIIYAEVPHEIWAGLRIDADPVTHINFFTENSLANLFKMCGLEILESQRSISNYGGSYMDVIWLVAKRSEQTEPDLLTVDIHKDLYPNRIESFRKLFQLIVKPKLMRFSRKFH